MIEVQQGQRMDKRSPYCVASRHWRIHEPDTLDSLADARSHAAVSCLAVSPRLFGIFPLPAFAISFLNIAGTGEPGLLRICFGAMLEIR